jgi:hypothetical protein
VSKVVGFCIFLTERLLISAKERNPKSTLPMADGTGCEMFMANYGVPQETTTAVLVPKECESKRASRAGAGTGTFLGEFLGRSHETGGQNSDHMMW